MHESFHGRPLDLEVEIADGFGEDISYIRRSLFEEEHGATNLAQAGGGWQGCTAPVAHQS